MDTLIFPLLIALLAVPLFLQARKQKKAMQEQQRLQNSLTTGDRVMTTSGLIGTIVGTTEERIDLEVADGVTTTWVRAAIREKVDTDADDTAVEDTESEVVEGEVAETPKDDDTREDTASTSDSQADDSQAGTSAKVEEQKTS